ncbi:MULTISPECIES: hypothetical protein [unclassified Mesorhizobium]|uniref:hypothetical protein n=1 Tax=unclassified Mesorhizobium TaxID=325217 RepID=UPI00112AC228|nr:MULTISPECIES: hypothetical protein [unclassified Mesorhizobium]MBZ9700894.1 hypothetical protein [Mesorhizobium sp. CO1-1-3]MBZ9946830.1 hypothetical protein [Mesorhizobium sp. BR1-1-11]TPJ04783.1 hypothetical protein FJ428_15845 [Mesorhizobium sp. B2-8-1]
MAAEIFGRTSRSAHSWELQRSVEIHQLLARNNQQAEAIGLQGTPAWIVGLFLIPGGLDFAQL